MAPTKRNPKAAKSEREVGSNANANGERDSNQGDDLGSQGGEGLDLYSMAEKMMQSTQKRRENRRQKIRLDYANAMHAIEEDMTATFNENVKRISKTYKTRAHNLAAVLRRRTAIENNIIASIERLNTAYNQAANELRLTVAGRVEIATKQDGSAGSTRASE